MFICVNVCQNKIDGECLHVCVSVYMFVSARVICVSYFVCCICVGVMCVHLCKVCISLLSRKQFKITRVAQCTIQSMIIGGVKEDRRQKRKNNFISAQRSKKAQKLKNEKMGNL